MRIFIIFILLLSTKILFSQSGPAGVGSSSSNILWNRSEDLSSLSNGDRITTWADQSGNSNDLSQPDALFKPEYVTNQQNGFPVVRFNQSNGRIRKTNFSDFPTSEITVFIVNKNSTESNDALFSYEYSDNEFLIFNSNNLTTFRKNLHEGSSVSANDNNWHIIDVSWNSNGGGLELWKDNTSSFAVQLSDGINIASNGCLAIAGEQDSQDGGYNAAQAHEGDFLEVIVYNIELNSAQRIIVSNYLAAKYGLSISNDYYSYQSSFSHDLAGIGRFDASNIHTAAQSDDIITIDGASAMTTDGEYLLFAHNDASISSWSSTACPNNIQKTARKWRIDETGDVGTIDITLNNDNLAAKPAGYSLYGIMVDADGDFTSGAIVYEMASSGSDYKATNVEITDGDYVCIVAIKPTVQFSVNSGSALENTNASADIELNYVAELPVSVDYATSNGSATAGSDYTAIAATTLNFANGDRIKTVSVSVTDDAIGESNENFDINLSSPSAGLNLGTNTTYTHTIYDNDNTRKIYFSSASSSASESTTSVNITVEINSADAGSATTVDYTVTGGTASGGGTDYTLSNGTLSIASGNTSNNISITINNDAIDEENETIIIKLSNPSNNCNLSSANPLEHTYTINDNDDAPTVYFTNTSSSGSESVSSKNIEVKLSAVSARDISVSFSVSGTASEGVDYSISTSSPITFAAGSTTKNISVSIVNDNGQEIDETLILTLSGPSNASLGANTTYTYTIIDNDIVGFVGPGGVGKSANLKLWVKAEDIPGSSNGDAISSWTDKSGNGNNLGQTDPAFRPLYYKSIVNGYQVARFSPDNARLVKNSFSDFPTAEITSYYVGYSTIGGDASISYAKGGSNNEYLMFGSQNVSVFRASSNKTTGIDARDAWSIVGASWRNSDDQVKAYLNGQKKYDNTLSSSSNIVQGGCLAIGAEQDAEDGNYDDGQDYEGDMAEIFIYSVILNNVQTNIINNYLSAKYNITMAANDFYAGDTPAKGNYDFEVIGIGKESDGKHAEAHGSGGIWLKQSSNFENGDYLFIGHNIVEPQLYKPADDAGLAAASIEERWGRDWYFDVRDVGGPATLDITFDFDEAEMNSASTPSGTTSNYKLLYRAGTSGDWAIVSSASSKTATQVIFSAQTLPNGDGYYTIGTIDATDSPLPIELLSFDVIEENKQAVLQWTTASETNNDNFEIQHSINTIDWQIIANIDGMGTSTVVHKYQYIDRKPNLAKNYYRLRQVDFDGEYSYSPIRVIDFSEYSDIEIYPNPANSTINISGIDKNSTIEVLDINSRIIDLDISYQNNKAVINIDKLPTSIYFIKIITNDKVEVFKIIKE